MSLDGTTFLSGIKTLTQTQKNTCLSCSDCIHKCSSTYAEDDFHTGYGADYCSKADREFLSEEDYEICAMFTQKENFIDTLDSSPSDDEELPF